MIEIPSHSHTMKFNTQWQYSILHVKLLHCPVQIRDVYSQKSFYFLFGFFEDEKKNIFKAGQVINLMRRMRYTLSHSLTLNPALARHMHDNLNKVFENCRIK